MVSAGDVRPTSSAAGPRSGVGAQAVSTSKRWTRPRGLSYTVPAVALFAIFIVYPVLWLIWTSISRRDAATSGHSLFGNYLAVLTDPIFWTAVRNMAYWAVLTIGIQTILGAVLAYFIETYTRRARVLFRTVFFLPVVTSVSVIAVVWQQIYAPNYGPLQGVLGNVGIHYNGNLLGDPTTVIFACIVVNIWEFTGLAMLLYMVGLYNVPLEVLDAAKVDGAKGLRLARHVLAPMLSNVTKSLLLLGVIGTLQTFPLVYLLTNGGPDNTSQIFGTYIFTKAFVENEPGYGAALSLITLLIAMAATLIQLRVFGSRFDLTGEKK